MKYKIILHLALILICISLISCNFSKSDLTPTYNPQTASAKTAAVASARETLESNMATQKVTTATATVPKYRVTKSTGLYDSFSVDAGMLDDLSVGSIVTPASGSSLSCDSITELGTVYTLCKVKVVSTGQTGWVLKKWIEKDN